MKPIPTPNGRYAVSHATEILEPYRSRFLWRFPIAIEIVTATFNTIEDVASYILNQHQIPQSEFSVLDLRTQYELLSTDNLNYSKSDCPRHRLYNIEQHPHNNLLFDHDYLVSLALQNIKTLDQLKEYYTATQEVISSDNVTRTYTISQKSDLMLIKIFNEKLTHTKYIESNTKRLIKLLKTDTTPYNPMPKPISHFTTIIPTGNKFNNSRNPYQEIFPYYSQQHNGKHRYLSDIDKAQLPEEYLPYQRTREKTLFKNERTHKPSEIYNNHRSWKETTKQSRQYLKNLSPHQDTVKFSNDTSQDNQDTN